jgi:16S rRNA (guanine1207-N2)-methyltransferase
MDLELAASRIEPGGVVLVHGSNRGGIKSAGARLEPWFDQVETLDARRHSRVWRGRRTEAPARNHLEDFVLAAETDPWGRARAWVSWPGCFARGALDPGTELLLRDLPALEGQVLDLACGVGTLQAGARASAGVWTGSDVDSLACRAAARNAKYHALITTEGLEGLPPTPWDWVVCNPPVHRGVEEDDSVLRALVYDLGPRMAAGGRLRVVVQRHRAFGKQLAATWKSVVRISENSQYQVLEAGR